MTQETRDLPTLSDASELRNIDFKGEITEGQGERKSA